MLLVSHILTALVALIHLYIVWLEMFAWTTRGRKVFKNFPAHLFEPTKALAANQGLYNGFLAAGLIWSFFITDLTWQMNIRYFFLGCVAVAGIYGAATADKKILFVQTVPALALSENGVLEKYGVQLIGANLNAIKAAEDRLLFRETMQKVGIPIPHGGAAYSFAEAEEIIKQTGYPVLVRASFAMGGTAQR